MMTLDDTYFMKQALIEAGKAAERGEVPVGAVVVCKERIIARAHNLTETLNDVTARQCTWRKVPERVYAVCYSRTLCDVCRCHCLGADRQTGFWCGR